MLLYCLLVAAVSLIHCDAASVPQNQKCPVTPYTPLDLSKVSGTWYALRGIFHYTEDDRNRVSNECPWIKFTIPDGTHVQFTLSSNSTKKYKLTIKDTTVPSIWTTDEETKKHWKFNHMQVNDITDNTLAVTMCGDERRISVILSREKTFNLATVDAITKRLATKDLPTVSSYDRCTA